ncbi:MAG: prepilin-type N-terminal cleavage/methylation domain-containing protein [Phycisphaerae bacterium]|nr:prepilin-type N-terminal cleavage/methylation domain-containing protein [Phycisphaerae bacterium]
MKGLAAFTLIEILVVVVLVGIMAGVTVFAIENPSDDAQQAADTSNVRILQNQVDAYRAAEGAYPATLADLITADPPYIRNIPGGETAWNYAADTGLVSRAE